MSPTPVAHSPRPRGPAALVAAVVLAVLGGLLMAPPATAAAPTADVVDGLVLRYDLTQTSGTDGRRLLRQRPYRHPGRRRHLDR